VAPATCQVLQGKTVATKPVTLSQSFLDQFKTLNLNSLGQPYATATSWMAHFIGDPTQLASRTLASNSEKEVYVDPSFAGTSGKPLGLDPFTLTSEGLTITARQTPPALLNALYNMPYTSGVLQSKKLFSQTYGYFEAKAMMPAGKAMWPAFWLLNSNAAWPPEIDVFEMFDGTNPNVLTMTTHWKQNGTGPHQFSYCKVTVPNAATEYHLYGVLWNSTRITYYVDHVPVVTLATPPGLNTSMYLLVNLAVENGITTATPASADFKIGWVTAYKY
jgi:beta-glucanase (GH16 family)